MTLLTRASTILLAAAVAAVIGASPSLAQTSDTPSGSTSQSGPQMNAPTHPGPNQWARDREWYGQPGWQGGYGWMGPWMTGPQHGWMMGRGHDWQGRHGWRRGHRGPRGARFTFTRGNARVDIQCPVNQSLKECVDAASTLIDKVGDMGPSAGQPQSPGGNGGPMPGNMPGGNMPNAR